MVLGGGEKVSFLSRDVRVEILKWMYYAIPSHASLARRQLCNKHTALLPVHCPLSLVGKGAKQPVKGSPTQVLAARGLRTLLRSKDENENCRVGIPV